MGVEMGIFKVEIKKNEEIINFQEEWYKKAKPMKDNQWKCGRSAMELANYILSGSGYLPKEIEDVLIKIGCKNDNVFKGEPEKITSLVGQGTGRHHDLFLEQSGEIVVGIEAKSDESLGKLISKELEYKNISDNKIKRINTLYKNIYGCNPYNGVDIKYQLLTGASATLLEAERKGISKALFLIITLKKEGSYKEKKFNENINDINVFINSLERYKSEDFYKFDAYPNVNLYIDHIEIDIN